MYLYDANLALHLKNDIFVLISGHCGFPGYDRIMKSNMPFNYTNSSL